MRQMEFRHNSKPLSLSIFLSLIFLIFPIIISSTPLTYNTFPTSLTQTRTRTHFQPLNLSQFGTTNNVISLPLHRVDSLNLTKTVHELLLHRLDRDVLRVQALVAKKQRHDPTLLNSPVYSGWKQGTGEFLTLLNLGYPPRPFQFLVDTGSDITWLQCTPCKHCYNQTGAVFNPALSKSLAVVPCGSKICEQLPDYNSNGCSQKQSCSYQVKYGDGSFTKGQLVTETLTFWKKHLTQFVMGCGHDNEGLFAGSTGIFGLGRGKWSFLAQKGRLFGHTFSYCLVDLFSDGGESSWLMFGKAAVSRKAVFTPMRISQLSDSFYTVRLNKASVGGAIVKLPAAVDLIVDSGTTITRLEKGAYEALRNTFRAANKHLEMVKSPLPSLLDTCYDLSGMKKVNVTTVELHFQGGVSMLLPMANFLIPLDKKTYCFAITPATDGVYILGNIQQQGFRVVFDVQNKRVGFVPDSC